MAVDNTQTPLATIHLAFEDEQAAAAAAAGGVKIEADSVRNRTTDSEGNDVEKTSFEVTDPYYFLVYHTSDLEMTRWDCCAGQVNYQGTTSRDREDLCVFTELNSAEDSTNKPSLSYVPLSGISQYWFTDYSSQFNQATGLRRNEDLSLYFTGGTVPCQVKLTYPVRFHSFDYLPPSDLTLDPNDETDSVTIYIVIYFRSTE